VTVSTHAPPTLAWPCKATLPHFLTFCTVVQMSIYVWNSDIEGELWRTEYTTLFKTIQKLLNGNITFHFSMFQMYRKDALYVIDTGTSWWHWYLLSNSEDIPRMSTFILNRSYNKESPSFMDLTVLWMFRFVQSEEIFTAKKE
jgi:uncharacterized protein involved in tolerance to divalent cations